MYKGWSCKRFRLWRTRQRTLPPLADSPEDESVFQRKSVLWLKFVRKAKVRPPADIQHRDKNQTAVKHYSSTIIHYSFFSKFLLCVLILNTLSSISSYPQIFDSIQSSLHKKPQLTANFGAKNTFIDGFRSPVFTARAGLDFDKRIKTGAGISWLKLPTFKNGRDNTPFYLTQVFGADTVHPALQFRYMSLFLEYIYFKTEKWEFSVLLQLGIGDSRYKYYYNGKKIVENKDFIFLYEPAVSGQYKITKWFGAGLDVGYRLLLINNKNIGSKFNSPVYDIRIIVFWRELLSIRIKEQ